MDPSSEPAKMRTRACITTPDGINWYYEQQRGTGPHHIVLVPDAVGDCHVFDEALPLIARDGGDGDGGSFTVTTFDSPGFSRSVPAPADACTSITAPKQAAQIVGLLDALGIRTATFWGSSSGGAIAVALSQMFPSRARSVMAHEAPTGDGGESKFFQALLDEPDDAVVADKLSAGLRRMYPAEMEKWEAKGAEFRDRLRANYPRWVRGYTASFGPSVPSPGAAGGPDGGGGGGGGGVPLDWSVGAATQVRMVLDGVVAVVRAGVPVHLLPGLHFPFTTDPEAFAEYVVERARQYL